jgi:hypothetical protein
MSKRKRDLTESECDEGLKEAQSYITTQLDGVDHSILYGIFNGLMDSEAESTDFCQRLLAMAGYCQVVGEKEDCKVFVKTFRKFCLIRGAVNYEP